MTLLTCTNKGCYQGGEHKLDVETNDVICEFCGGAVNVTDYMKKILKNSKQVLKKVKSSKEIKCNNCGVGDTPILLTYGHDTVAACKHCKTVHQHLSKYFVQALLLNKDIERMRLSGPPKPTPKQTKQIVAAPARASIKSPPKHDVSELSKEEAKLKATLLKKAKEKMAAAKPETKKKSKVAAKAKPKSVTKVSAKKVPAGPKSPIELLEQAGVPLADGSAPSYL